MRICTKESVGMTIKSVLKCLNICGHKKGTSGTVLQFAAIKTHSNITRFCYWQHDAVLFFGYRQTTKVLVGLGDCGKFLQTKMCLFCSQEVSIEEGPEDGGSCTGSTGIFFRRNDLIEYVIIIC